MQSAKLYPVSKLLHSPDEVLQLRAGPFAIRHHVPSCSKQCSGRPLLA